MKLHAMGMKLRLSHPGSGVASGDRNRGYWETQAGQAASRSEPRARAALELFAGSLAPDDR